jgi:hypothetical protein
MSFFAFAYGQQSISKEIADIDVEPLSKTSAKPIKYIKTKTGIEVEFEDESNAFPIIISVNRPDVAEKINLMLQVSYLSQVPGIYKDNDPYFYSDNNGECGQNVFLGYSIITVTNKIIEAELNSEKTYCTGIGSANENMIEYFDLVTGNKIVFDDLFNKDHLTNLKAEAINSFKQQFDNYEKDIKYKLKTSSEENDQEIYQGQLELYSQCKKYTSIESFNNYEFLLSKGEIKIVRNNCWSNEFERGIDEYASPSFIFKLSDYTSTLSEYGKYIMGYSEVYSPTRILESKILKGLIADKYPITAVIKRVYNDGSLDMYYWYNKVGIPIELHGKLINGVLTLVENDYHNETEHRWIPKANISAKVTNTKIEGFWENYKTKEKLKFKLDVN